MKLAWSRTRRSNSFWPCSALFIAMLLMVLAARTESLHAQFDPALGEALARGPIHEAFANLTPLTPTPGIVVPKVPPEPINEVPPLTVIEGEHVVWIPGYWAWDDERDDFIWLSGVWRNPPPGTHWIPGYWHEARGGFRWAPGYWSTDHAIENPNIFVVTRYLPPPPESLENGPPYAAPSPNHVWVPGNWVWHDRYYWRPGHWVIAQPNWIWVPDHYVWTPHGFIYAAGYWDYPLTNRGLVYAPVYFSSGIHRRPGFRYQPAIVINTNLISLALFGRPAYSHYYFGDYYAGHYAGIGIYPSYALNRYAYNPIYTHQAWENRNNPHWSHDVRAHYLERREHPDLRPPHTYREFHDRRDRIGPRDALVISAQEAHHHDGRPMQFQQLDATRHEDFVNRSHHSREFGEERHRIESGAANRIPPPSMQRHDPPVQHIDVPRSKVSGPGRKRFSEEHAPPHRPDHPEFEQHFRKGPPSSRRD